MRTDDVTDITRENATHKFGGDPMAMYLHWLSLNSLADADGGHVAAPTGWYAQFGKRLLREDDRGFVWVERYATKALADEMYATLEDEFAEWDEDETADDWIGDSDTEERD